MLWNRFGCTTVDFPLLFDLCFVRFALLNFKQTFQIKHVRANNRNHKNLVLRSNISIFPPNHIEQTSQSIHVRAQFLEQTRQSTAQSTKNQFGAFSFLRFAFVQNRKHKRPFLAKLASRCLLYSLCFGAKSLLQSILFCFEANIFCFKADFCLLQSKHLCFVVSQNKDLGFHSINLGAKTAEHKNTFWCIFGFLKFQSKNGLLSKKSFFGKANLFSREANRKCG